MELAAFCGCESWGWVWEGLLLHCVLFFTVFLCIGVIYNMLEFLDFLCRISFDIFIWIRDHGLHGIRIWSWLN